MTAQDFWGPIEHNLRLLAGKGAPLPEYGLTASRLVWRSCRNKARCACGVEALSSPGRPMPPDVRAWDVVGARRGKCPPLRFRVFACYVAEATDEAVRRVKFALRCWYEMTGLDSGDLAPYAGVLVIGCGRKPEANVVPNGSDVPHGIPEMWVWPMPDGGFGSVQNRSETLTPSAWQALVPETFDVCRGRIRKMVDDMLVLDGLVNAEMVAGRAHVSPTTAINVFYDLMRDTEGGAYTVRRVAARKAGGGTRTEAERVRLERGQPGWIQSWATRFRDEWYIPEKHVEICPGLSLSVLFLRLVIKLLSMLVLTLLAGTIWQLALCIYQLAKGA